MGAALVKFESDFLSQTPLYQSGCGASGGRTMPFLSKFRAGLAFWGMGSSQNSRIFGAGRARDCRSEIRPGEPSRREQCLPNSAPADQVSQRIAGERSGERARSPKRGLFSISLDLPSRTWTDVGAARPPPRAASALNREAHGEAGLNTEARRWR